MTVMVTIEHVRAARLAGAGVLCAPGIHAWARRHGVDLRRLSRGGIPVEEADRIDDEFARRVAAIARAEAAR